jgi:P pilus assembly chaperone PapD
MKKTNSQIVLLISVFISLFLPEINAQELEVSPGTLTFATNPGSSQTQQITVRNKGNTEQSFVFNLGDWLTDENGEVKYFSPGTTGRSCADWITVSPNLVTLQPNEGTTVNVTMLVPNDNSSTKWAVLFVQSAVEQTGPKAIDKDVQMGMQLSLRIAVPIFQSPSGNKLYKATLEGLTERIGDDNLRTYQTQVINLGDKILNCKVYFTVSNLETAEEFTSPPMEFSLLPESNKNVEYTLEKPLVKGRYSVAAILDYGYNDELEGIQLDIEVK